MNGSMMMEKQKPDDMRENRNKKSSRNVLTPITVKEDQETSIQVEMTVVDTINTVEVRDMMEEEEVKALLLREVDRVEECVIKEEEMMDI